MPLQFSKSKTMRLRSYSVSPKIVSRSLSTTSPFPSARDLLPQTPPESAAATSIQESVAVQELPVQILFDNEGISVNEAMSFLFDIN